MTQAYNHDSLVFLTEQLGYNITAALSGTRNRTDVAIWVVQQATPTPEQTARINFARSLFQRVCEARGDEPGLRMTRAWFIGGNVGSSLDTPMTGIRENRFDEVNASITRLLEEDYYGAYSDEAATLAEKYCGVFLI